MIYDDIIVGAGMSALGVALGLDKRAKTLILAGPSPGNYLYYDSRRGVPCAYLGLGGLGNAWHGVIPMSRRTDFAGVTDGDFAALFSRFYSHSDVASRLHRCELFVPWRPIRPQRELVRLSRERDALTIVADSVDRIDVRGAQVTVYCASGQQISCRRLWIAAGALHTPMLLQRSFGPGLARSYVSDHLLCYAGLASDCVPPRVTRNRDGVFFQSYYDSRGEALYTLRPARFGFRQLDFGIEQRAVFGMPTGSAVARIAKRMSPALLAEALYNRAGLFRKAAVYSVCAQIAVKDAYALGPEPYPLTVRTEVIANATAKVSHQSVFPGLVASRRHDLFIPGIHLHGSVDSQALAAYGLNSPDASVRVVDASVLGNIGPEHHSFKMLVAAFIRAQGSYK